MTLPEWFVEDLGVRYRRSPTWALRGVDLRMSSGAVALLGPNGAGKTTLFRVLSTTLPPTAGRFGVGASDSTDRASVELMRRWLGYLPQDFRAFGGYTCQELVAYVAWLRRVPRREVADAVTDSLAAVGLEDRAAVQVKALSGGMRQRLGLAQALVNRPDLLLLDEPTVGLDPEQRATFMRYLTSIAQTTSVLLATHLVEDVAAFATDVVVLNTGRVSFAGDVHDFCELGEGAPVTGPAVEAAYLHTIRANRAG